MTTRGSRGQRHLSTYSISIRTYFAAVLPHIFVKLGDFNADLEISRDSEGIRLAIARRSSQRTLQVGLLFLGFPKKSRRGKSLHPGAVRSLQSVFWDRTRNCAAVN